LGSGGKRVSTRPPHLPVALSSAMIWRMKLELGTGAGAAADMEERERRCAEGGLSLMSGALGLPWSVGDVLKRRTWQASADEQ
jgi:hypothetical protein